MLFWLKKKILFHSLYLSWSSNLLFSYWASPFLGKLQLTFSDSSSCADMEVGAGVLISVFFPLFLYLGLVQICGSRSWQMALKFLLKGGIWSCQGNIFWSLFHKWPTFYHLQGVIAQTRNGSSTCICLLLSVRWEVSVCLFTSTSHLCTKTSELCSLPCILLNWIDVLPEEV